MSCLSCYPVNIKECPEYIAIDAGLISATKYRWEITDKFNTTYAGLATTDAPGVLWIPVKDNTDFPAGYFMHFSGSFTLQLFVYDTDNHSAPADFIIDSIAYDCLTLNIQKYIGDTDDFVSTPTTQAPYLEIHISAAMAGVNYVAVADLNGKKYRLERVGAGTLPKTSWNYLPDGGWQFTDPSDLVQEKETFYAYFITAEPEVI